MTESQQSPGKTPAPRSSAKAWAEERAAMQEGARERTAASRRSPADEGADGMRDVLGEMWPGPVSFAVTKLTPGVEARIAELVKKAAG